MFLNTIRLTINCLKCPNSNRLVQARLIPDMRKYSSKHARQPSKILNEEEILQHFEPAKGPNEYIGKKNNDNEHKQLKVRPKKSKFKKKLSVTSYDKTIKEDGKLNYLELKENDTTLTTLMMQVRSRKTRDRNSRIILEGQRLITDAIEAGAVPEIVIFSRISDVLKLKLPESGVKLYRVPYRAIQTWKTENTVVTSDALPLTIICDNIREPGNMGSIMRAAAGVGCKKLILLKGCVDIWDPKVLRSATGAHFRFPIYATQTWADVRKLIDEDSNIYIADNNITEKIVEPRENKNIESELAAADEATECQENENDEHENVDEDDDDDDDDDIIDDEGQNNGPIMINEDDLLEMVKNSDEKKSYRQKMNDIKISKQLTSNIPVIPYYASDYTNGETVVIIGGETSGLSLDALALVQDRGGIRVNIPMTNGVESLNTGMALGIITFEIKKQFSIKPTVKATE
ncbi:hypothetical protein HCN44_004058 [Aphidius gifuensis]|uniref:tRNA/rRNA methyltransferase SpoU type domain-containing protein n=1 Tax=Aphidius gifuensis TaxID=684658 RepID=A0A834XXE8_APHGI|nr:hypothetical protein HCN44_004058 [Aphidius gifuensis]